MTEGNSLTESMDRILEKLAQRPERFERTFRCKCQDTGIVTVSTEGRDAVRPCERCNQRGFALWKAGCYRSDHYGCEKCRPGKARRGGEVYE